MEGPASIYESIWAENWKWNDYKFYSAAVYVSEEYYKLKLLSQIFKSSISTFVNLDLFWNK